MKEKITILMAKPGLDGHDKGAKIISFALQDAGMNVIYTGLHKTIDEIIDQAEENDVDVIGLSIMTGTHLSICEECVKKMSKRNISNKKILVGGVIPKKDEEKLINIGIDGVFPNGTKIKDIVESIKSLF